MKQTYQIIIGFLCKQGSEGTALKCIIFLKKKIGYANTNFDEQNQR